MENQAELTTQAHHASVTVDISEVTSWMMQYLETKHPEVTGKVHGEMSFDSVGLDSLGRVEMLTAMEGCFKLKLDPTLAYDFVTVGALSKYVWGQINGI